MSRLLPFVMLALAALAPAPARAEVKILLGRVETVMLDPRLGLQLDAKLDTGADTSSLDAHDIRRVRVGEKRYVRFSVRHPESGEWVADDNLVPGVEPVAAGKARPAGADPKRPPLTR